MKMFRLALGLTLGLTFALVSGCDDETGTDPDADVGGGDGDVSGDVPTDTVDDVPTDTVDDVPTDTVDDVPADTVDDVPADTVDDVPMDADDATDTAPTCIPPATPNPTSGHRVGQDCLSCHASMSGSRRFTIAGTLYDSAAGTTAVGGATIVVVDSASTEVRLVTAGNGNFFTTQAVTPPLTVRASRCPDDAEMISTASSGSCNWCHGAGNRVHLP